MGDDIKGILAFWCTQHQRVLGSKYMISYGKDNTIMKQIVTTYGVDKTYKLISLFYKEIITDPFLKQTGATVGILKSQIPKLLMKINENKEDEQIGKL